jgi:FkbM family methyltransferase
MSKEVHIVVESHKITCDTVYAPEYDGKSSLPYLLPMYNQCVYYDQYRLEEIIKDGQSVVVDVGASVGLTTMFAARLGAAKIFSFEPNPIDRLALEFVARDNPSVVTAISAAVSDTNGSMMLCISPSLGGSEMVPLENDDRTPLHEEILLAEDAIEISTTTLDSFFEDEGVEVDILKIDAEGCEKRVLAGAEGLLNRWRPTIVMASYHRPEDRDELPEVVRQICPAYDVEEHFLEEGLEPMIRMRAR